MPLAPLSGWVRLWPGRTWCLCFFGVHTSTQPCAFGLPTLESHLWELEGWVYKQPTEPGRAPADREASPLLLLPGPGFSSLRGGKAQQRDESCAGVLRA